MIEASAVAHTYSYPTFLGVLIAVIVLIVILNVGKK